MAENTEHTLSTYLGPEFQQRLIWQLLVEPEFAEKTIPNLAIEYFDDPYLKRLFIIILEYFKANEKVPNLQNQSIQQAINTYKTPNNIIEEESLFAVIKKIELWNERIINKQILYEGDVVRRETSNFIKQQEYRKTGEFILTSTKNGDIRKKTTIASIEEKFQKIQHIGDDEDYGISVFDNIEHVLRKEFRQTIPTGIGVIDTLTGGGLGKGEIGIVLSPSGVGKALPNSHKVLTINGWVENGSLSVNDIVFGSNGKPQTILGVFPQGKRKIYKIVFSDQTTAYCDAEHLWSVNSFNQRNQKTNIRGKTLSIPDHTFQILKTSEIMEDVKIKGGLNYRLPNVLPIEFNKTDVKIDPYVMGILLGDGCLTKKNQPHIITSDLFIVDKICGLEKNIVVHEYEGRKENYKKLYRISLLNSRKILEDELNLYGTDSSTKFIPENYLHNCIEYREKLLQGLIDSDGGVGKNSAIIYSTVSKKLSENVRELVLSLGGTCRTTEKYKTYTNKEGLKVSGKNNYCLTISFPNNGIIPCTLPAKLNRVVIREKYEFNKFIKSVEYSHEEEATCIYVESNDHLYVIDDYILTHNTTILTKIANTAYDEGKNVAQIILEDIVEQVQRKHFAIWANSALSKMDEENENTRVNRIIHEKAIEMSGKGNLVIKKFSQENTTMMDIRNWMIGYQKKYGIKFDILVLDYLDVLDSHKKTHDRNEDELVIIKSFEALAADFEIPGWSAVQTNRSGFNAEYVEAYQTGGSIKRVQKAHFFMSIAKTPDQKEANLASIRIIKARFAQDGQTFTDCIFNNDTMQIIIEDKRYPVKTTLRKQTEDDVNRINDTAEIVKRSSDINIHAQINQRVMSLTEMVNDPAINDDLVDLKQFEKLTGTENVPIVNMHVCADHELTNEEAKRVLDFAQKTLNESEGVKKDDIIEIDETVKIETVNEELNNIMAQPSDKVYYINPAIGMSKNDGLLELSGDTVITKVNEIEVKLEDLPSKGLNLEKNIIVKEVNFSPSKEIIPVETLTKEQRKEIEKNELLIDPDASPIEQVDMIKKLKSFEMHQPDIIKK